MKQPDVSARHWGEGMSFVAQLTGFGYCNDLTGKGWPDYVTLNNGGILAVDYESRTYYPADVRALLALADRMEKMAGKGACLTHGGLEKAAEAIREALGVES